MIARLRMILVLVLAASLTACAGAQGDNRYLQSLGNRAQPSNIVATELAFAREAREKGYWKAYAQYAAKDAIVFDQNGPRLVSDYIAEKSRTSGAFTWEVRQVFMSCDGSHAASMGTFTHSSGVQGIYTTIWERQKKGDYRFIIDFPQIGETWEGAVDMVTTRIGECRNTTREARTGLYEPIRWEMERDAAAKNIQMYQGISPDQSFAWFAGHASAKDRGVMLGTFTHGRWLMMIGQHEEASENTAMSAVPAEPRP